MIPDTDLRRVRRWAAQRVPPHARHRVRVELQVPDRAITIVERRPPWRVDFGQDWTSFPIARLRFTKSRKEWTLYWRDRHLRCHRYDDAPPMPHIEELIAVVDDNRTGIFWG